MRIFHPFFLKLFPKLFLKRIGQVSRTVRAGLLPHYGVPCAVFAFIIVSITNVQLAYAHEEAHRSEYRGQSTDVSRTTSYVVQQTVQVSLYDNRIVPSTMTGRKGQKFDVEVVNRGTKTHNLVIPDFFIFTQNLKSGERVSASFVPDKTGNFPYYSDAGGKPEPGLRGQLTISP